MENFLFKDYIKPTVGNLEQSNNIKAKTIKQISRGRFEIKEYECKVEILLEENKRIVIIDNSNSIFDLFNALAIAESYNEPSLEILKDFLLKEQSNNEPLCTILKKYQEQYYKSGNNFDRFIYFKLYSKKELKHPMRDRYEAKWIDYEKQLESDSIIYDETGVCGLWAMPFELCKKCYNNEECFERYGNNILIVKTISDCSYLFDKKEIIGDRFKVIGKCTPDQFHIFKDVLENLTNEIEDNQKELKKKDNKLNTLKNNYTHIVEKNNLFYNTLTKYKSLNIILIIIVIILFLTHLF